MYCSICYIFKDLTYFRDWVSGTHVFRLFSLILCICILQFDLSLFSHSVTWSMPWRTALHGTPIPARHWGTVSEWERQLVWLSRNRRNVAANLICTATVWFGFASSDCQTVYATGFAIIALHLTAKWFPFPSNTRTHTSEHKTGREWESAHIKSDTFKSVLCVRAQQVWGWAKREKEGERERLHFTAAAAALLRLPVMSTSTAHILWMNFDKCTLSAATPAVTATATAASVYKKRKN